MKPVSSVYLQQRKKLIIRALVAYSGVMGVIAVALLISISHGAGWRPAMAGMPLYIILFGGITYQFVKETMILKRRERERQDKDFGVKDAESI
jgi:NhaP-type Na+/H+ or K+/H+ antiporter